MSKDGQVRDGQHAERSEFQALFEPEPRAVLTVALPEAQMGQKAATQDPLGEPLSIRDVARLLGCSVWTVRQRCLPQGLPHFRVAHSGKLMFYRNQVTHWIIDKQKRERR